MREQSSANRKSVHFCALLVTVMHIIKNPTQRHSEKPRGIDTCPLTWRWSVLSACLIGNQSAQKEHLKIEKAFLSVFPFPYA